ncbi:hypothetical protein [Oceaniovalibus sp. ACAM 378]|uniref:hypothetical protein n=1 Tax=Oceaniovalibus sp. ACAM 378 TaxID=2599923 RepID=UPI0011DC1701|nr:hypothetical protein [Oceaniovalibus sp. ACAM 378]TYB86317.1 hypothetical protein FQ320_16310 [Oceaniovalibus sp. ACAM 378]
MSEPERRIIGMTIDALVSGPAPSRHHARLRTDYGRSDSTMTGTTDCLCQSTLPKNAPPDLVFKDLIAHIVGQMARMREIWSGEFRLRLCLSPESGNLKS